MSGSLAAQATAEISKSLWVRILSPQKRSDIASAWCQAMAEIPDYDYARRRVFSYMRQRYGSWILVASALIQLAISILRLWWERKQGDPPDDILGHA